MDNIETIVHLVRCLAGETCAGEHEIVDMLEGICWNEERGGEIMRLIAINKGQ